MAKDNHNPPAVIRVAATPSGVKVSANLRPTISSRKKLCELLGLRSPDDEQIWADAAWEIGRLRAELRGRGDHRPNRD